MPIFIRKYVLNLIIILVTIFVATIYCLKIDNFTFQNLIVYLSETSHTTHQNFMEYGKINGVPIPVYIYNLICICAVVLLLINKALALINKRFTLQRSPLFYALISTFTLATIMATFQTVSIIKQLPRYKIVITNKSETLKFQKAVLANVLRMAEFCRHKLPGSHAAEFVTDLDISRDPHMLKHRSLAYYLYPIDIRGVRNEKPTVWIAFEKQNAEDFVPEGYTILGKLNEENIIAIKNN